jgi:hypothetical protein
MDVAGFVGFAAAGPLDVPVPVEDPSEYAAIFGDEDVTLAWDAELEREARSQLGPAVRAFFANGGRRCFVVRVGAAAETASFVLPGMLARDGRRSFRRAELPARAPGSFADELAVATAIASTPLGLARGSLRTLEFDLAPPAPGAVAPGDLLRLEGNGFVVFVAVRSVAPHGGRGLIRAHGDRGAVVWVDEEPFAPPAAGTADVIGLDLVERRSVPVTVRLSATPGRVELDLDLPPAGAPDLGATVLVQGVGPNRRALVVDAVLPPDPGAAGVTVRGRLVRLRGAVPRALRDADPELAEVVSFELEARRGERDVRRLGGLGFAAAHPRWPGRLPSDARLFDPDRPAPAGDAALWRDATTPRFPLAGDGLSPRVTLFPLGMDVLPRLSAPPRPSPRTAAARDGVAVFDDSLFLDRKLAPTRTAALGAQADAIRWLSPEPRLLRGLHGLFHQDEVTLVAVPDATQRPWSWAARPELPPATADPRRDHPDLSGFHGCALRLLAAPTLELVSADESGRVELAWASPDAGATFVVAESADPAFADAAEVYRGPSARLELHRRGAAYYRVHAEDATGSSDWSNAVAADASPRSRLVLEPPESYSPASLLAVHRALLRLCAARGDVVAALALPAHLREDAAAGHAAALAAPPTPADWAALVPPLDAGEQQALGFGAIYHPWLVGLDGGASPPDGAATGLLAARAAERGAWVAAANVPLRDVVALAPRLPRGSSQRLQDARVNAVRQEPRGFLLLAQDTLAPDDELRPLNVRRLLCLLRRLALLHGPRYVFEPNDPPFRRAVQRSFDELLGTLFRLGAFAGATREQAFQVVTGDPPNTPQSVDAGALIVELRVAPSRPLVFLTVRLVNAARGLQVEGA